MSTHTIPRMLVHGQQEIRLAAMRRPLTLVEEKRPGPIGSIPTYNVGVASYRNLATPAHATLEGYINLRGTLSPAARPLGKPGQYHAVVIEREPDGSHIATTECAVDTYAEAREWLIDLITSAQFQVRQEENTP